MKSIRSILIAMLLCGLGAALLVGLTAQWGSQRMQEQATTVFVAKDVTADVLPPPMYLIEARLTLSQAVEGTLSPGDALKTFQRLRQEYQARVDFWQKNPPYGLEKALLGAQHDAAQVFLKSAEQDVLQPLGSGNVDAARSALPAVQKLYEAHRAGVDQTVSLSTTFANDKAQAFEDVQKSAQRWAIGTLVLALAACAALYVGARRRLSNAIAVPLQQACQVTQRIATGDLTSHIRVHGRDEAAAMLAALADMQERLREVVGHVRSGVDSIATASVQIAHGNSDLSARTERQASSLEETAATMEQMTSTVQTSADSAREATRLATDAAAAASKGGEVVSQVVATMGEIQQASRKIEDIISVIDGIAFQTNILALNAAVEAARAGEHGRGFAVVAGEVRTLAQRAAQAAREIKSLIGASVERVDAGGALVADAGTTMQDIVGRVHEVSRLIGEISVATREQTTGLGQVNVAVSELDEMTQQNSALVEESAAAAESLSAQAKKLTEAVAVFRLNGTAG